MKKLVYLLSLAFLFACGGAKDKKEGEHGANDGAHKVEEKAEDMMDELNHEEEGETQVRGEASEEEGHEEHGHEEEDDHNHDEH